MLTDKPVVLHVGLMKTGTTALQMDLLSQLPEVHYVGQPLDRLFHHVGRFFTAILEDDDAAWQRGLPTFAERFGVLFETDRSTIVLSDEHLSCGRIGSTPCPDTIADRLKQLFPHAQVVLVLRDQLTALPSLYAYAMTLGPREHVSFDRWIRSLLDSPSSHQGLGLFDHGTHVHRYAARFGDDRVHVLFFEDLRDNPAAFLAELTALCGDTRTDPRTLALGRHNARPTRRGIAAMRVRAALPCLAALEARLPRRVKAALDAWLAAGPAPDTRWTPRSRARIADVYRSSNASLDARLGPKLRALGYPLP